MTDTEKLKNLVLAPYILKATALIGQKRNVLVHKMICKGTIEEKIDQLINEKKALASDILQVSGESLLTEMNDAQLLNLVRLDIDQLID